jgi:O-antigen/teichoic acid export membrane protein
MDSSGTDEPAQHPVLARLSRDTSLADGARQGAMRLGAGRVVAQAFQFAVSIVVARLLLPSQFGEAALVLSVSAFAQIFTDLGLGAAIVQARLVTQKLLCSAFWLNLASGVALACGFSALAVPLASFYDNPRLAGLLVLASLNFVLACGVVQLALLERSFNFRTVAIVETFAAVVGVAAVPILALAGMGTYSLVIGPLIGTTLLSASLWYTVRWWPTERPDLAATKELWSFARGLVGFNAVNYWSRNLDNLVLGKVVSAGDLGEYSRSYNLMYIPVQQSSQILGRALYPALARMQEEPQRMARAWSRALGAASAVTLPVALTIAATAPYLVHVLYGPRWAGMVTVLELLMLSAVPQIPAAASGVGYRATGRTDLLFRLALVSVAFTVVATFVGAFWGAEGVAASVLIRSWLMLWVVMAPLARILDVSSTFLLGPIYRSCGPAIAMVVGELVVRFAVGGRIAPWQVLSLQLVVGGALYAFAVRRSTSEASELTKAVVRRRLDWIRSRRATIK